MFENNATYKLSDLRGIEILDSPPDEPYEGLCLNFDTYGTGKSWVEQLNVFELEALGVPDYQKKLFLLQVIKENGNLVKHPICIYAINS